MKIKPVEKSNLLIEAENLSKDTKAALDKFKESIACISTGDDSNEECSMEDKMAAMVSQMSYYVNCMNSLYDSISYVHDRIDRVWSEIWDHEYNGHFPKINGAEQMQKVVTACGLDGEYDVQKKVIYANTRNGGVEAILEYKK